MLEKAFQTLKKLDYGDDIGPLAELDDVIAQTKNDEKTRAAVEQGLLQILKSDATVNGKDYACRKLKVVGGDAAVPVLAAMLSDKRLAHMARYALESMPSDAAGKALLDALGSLTGKLKAGVIGSLGVRQENGAVATLSTLLSDKDAVVAKAAAGALGAIRSKDAAQALSHAKPNADAVPLAIDSSLACAESVLADGDKATALMVYQQLMKGDPPKHVKVAATKGILNCRKS